MTIENTGIDRTVEVPAEIPNGSKYPFATFTIEDVANQSPALIASLNPQILQMQGDTDNETGRLDAYNHYRDWYAGKHGAQLSERQKEHFEAASGIPFSNNFTDVIVDSVVRRLQLSGLSYSPENEAATELTEMIFKQNRMDIGTSRVHHNAVKLGDAFVICDFDQIKQQVKITYNRPDIMRPEYDDDTGETMLWASKVWKTNVMSPFNTVRFHTIGRMNVYYPDRIEKYYRRSEGTSGTWLPYMDVATDMMWPVPWIDETSGEPLGIPVFHFRNKTLDGHFGVSEIAKVIPQQAILNKWLLDLDLISDTQGYPQRWASGVSSTSVDSDGNTNNTPLPTEPGETWTTPNTEAKFGQFDSAPLDGALKAIDMIVRHISASNSTPIDDLLASHANASGESLKMKDSGLSDKADEKTMLFGNVWEDINRYAIKLWNTFATNKPAVIVDDTTEIDAKWKDTAPRNEKNIVAVLQGLVSLGASKEWALREYGVDNVDDVLQEAADEASQAADIASEAGLRAITRGTDTLVDDDEVSTINSLGLDGTAS